MSIAKHMSDHDPWGSMYFIPDKEEKAQIREYTALGWTIEQLMEKYPQFFRKDIEAVQKQVREQVRG